MSCSRYGSIRPPVTHWPVHVRWAGRSGPLSGTVGTGTFPKAGHVGISRPVGREKGYASPDLKWSPGKGGQERRWVDQTQCR